MSVFSIIINLLQSVSIPAEYKGVHAVSYDTAPLEELINRRSDKSAVRSSYRTGDNSVHAYINSSVGDPAQSPSLVHGVEYG